MLIPSPRLRIDDLPLWDELERADRVHGSHKGLSQRAYQAVTEIAAYRRRGPCYCGVSWGKDSTVVASLVLTACRLHGLQIPLVWVRVEPICNPDCAAVRDAFLADHDCEYHEIVTHCTRDEGGWHASGTLEQGFRAAASRLGTRRHISGIRADESGTRTMSVRRLGVSTQTSCRPLAHWTGYDVFGWLARKDLPVHPAYAMLGGGRWEREHLRVASLGGTRGDNMGRAEWEREYYGDVLRRLTAARAASESAHRTHTDR